MSVAPDIVVDECKAEILNNAKLTASRYQVDLYSIVNLEADLDNVEVLGALSLSSIGSSLPALEPIEKFVGPRPHPHRLHLILIDNGVPLQVACWIPGADPAYAFDLFVYRRTTVPELIDQIKSKLRRSDDSPYFAIYKSALSISKGLANEDDQPLNPNNTLDEAFCNIPFSLLPCVVIRPLPKRKHHLSWDVVERAKSQKIASPSSMTTSVYHTLQENTDTRFLDYRTSSVDPEELPEKDLAPIEVLYEGFGQFLDALHARSPGRTQVDTLGVQLDRKVDDFARSMARTFRDEAERRSECLEALNAIFKPVLGFPYGIARHCVSMVSADGPPPMSDGHYVHGPSRIPCIIIGVKNEDIGTNAIPEVELATYYNWLVQHVSRIAPDALRKSRLPTLGITVIENDVTFFALAYVGSVVYVPLTTGMWCLPIDCGATEHRQLYVAFSAASALLARIIRDAEALPTALRIDNHFFPAIHALCRCSDPDATLHFEITEIISKTLGRQVYRARSRGGDLVIKLARSYSLELHRFCADLGRAPKLYAVQKLPGGFVAVAMEHVAGCAIEPGITPACQDQWIEQLKGLVARFHAAQLVHGDLRAQNLICVDDRIMLLDFDWGGKEGEASYPAYRKLNPQLTRGRDMRDLKITKEDDERVLADTLEYIRECAQPM